MDLIFDRTKTIEKIAPMLCAVSTKSTIKAAEGILIEAKEPNLCILTTFDTEKGIRREIEAEVREGGTYVIHAQKFMQTLRVMEGEKVNLTVDEKLNVCFSSGKSSHRMNAFRGEDFPTLPVLRDDRGFEVGQAVLKKMIGKISFAMGVNDQRVVLNGCYFKVTENQLLLVSCDSFKLARCSVRTPVQNRTTTKDGEESSETLNFSFIVPVRTVNELQKLLSDGEEETVLIHVSRKYIVFRIAELTFFSRLVDGDYIDYDRIILRNHRIIMEINRAALISALERAALVTEERIAGSVRSHVKLSLEEDLLKIMATSAAGSTYDEIPIRHEGNDLVIAFNNRFLINSISACDGETVRVSLSSPISSINIEPVKEETGEEEGNDCEELFMLLPVRIKE